MAAFVNIALIFVSILLGIAFLGLCFVKIKNKDAEWWQLLFMFLAGVAFCCFGISKIL